VQPLSDIPAKKTGSTKWNMPQEPVSRLGRRVTKHGKTECDGSVLTISMFHAGGLLVPDVSPQPGKERPFVGVQMKCCHTYVRAYLNPAQDAYVGWCPRCAAQVRFEIVSEGGSTSRFFEAG
jgi:hypothetical protein